MDLITLGLQPDRNLAADVAPTTPAEVESSPAATESKERGVAATETADEADSGTCTTLFITFYLSRLLCPHS